MLVITRDGAKIIDKKMKFKEDLLSRRKQEKLIFKYLFRFNSLWPDFLVVFLILLIPTGFVYYSILSSNGGVEGKTVLCFAMFVTHLLLTYIFVKDGCVLYKNTFFKLSKRVLTRLEQIDSSIIDTTLEERTEIAEWFIEEERLVGIRKDSNDSYTLFYRNSGNIDEERVYLCIHKIPITTEISNQMIKGYVYSISDLLTYNARSNKE
jgi:hypothetical protein